MNDLNEQMERLRASKAPLRLGDAVRLIETAARPLMDEIKSLRRRVEALEDAGAKRKKGDAK